MDVVLIFLLMFLLILFGMPVGFAMGFAGIVGLFLTNGLDRTLVFVGTEAYSAVANPTLATVPLFILMGELFAAGGIARDLFTSLQKFVGRIPGGVAITTVFTSAGFGAISGSTTAAAAALSRITMPEFKRLGYDMSVASGVVTVSGTLAIMIPPSIPMIIYGVYTQTSVGKLLLAGLIPGLLTALVYTVGILCWSRIKPGYMPGGISYSWGEKFASLKNLWGFILIVAFILFALYGGIATPAEVAALGALFSLVVVLVMRRLSWKSFFVALEKTLRTTVMIFAIIIGAMIFGRFLTLTRVTQSLLEWVGGLSIGAWGIMIIIVFIYILLGCILDSLAILLITLPLTFPLVTSLGFDPIWFGVIVIKLVEIGLVTPPVGLNAFIVSGSSGVPLEKVFKGSATMLLFEAVSLVLLLMFPAISTWLPSIIR
jgi:tripartite ATP-independent transporter DctM subunit